MGYLVISNTYFGYKNNDDFWLNLMLSYFQSEIISYVKKYKPTIIHLGGLFWDKNNLSIKTITDVQKLFSEISKYTSVYFIVDNNDFIINKDYNVYNILSNIENINIVKDYLILDNNLLFNDYNNIKNIKFDNVFTNSVNINKLKYNNLFTNKTSNIEVSSPYSLNNRHTKNGFYLVKDSQFEFIENTISPIYVEFSIKSDDDYNNIQNVDFKNFITLNIDNEYYLCNKYKIEMFINKYKLYKVNFIKNDKEIKKTENINVSYDYNVDNILDDYFKNNDLKEHYENIKNILKNKNI